MGTSLTVTATQQPQMSRQLQVLVFPEATIPSSQSSDSLAADYRLTQPIIRGSIVLEIPHELEGEAEVSH